MLYCPCTLAVSVSGCYQAGPYCLEDAVQTSVQRHLLVQSYLFLLSKTV